jgi:carboxypeptidase C (cathepsin A)
LYIDQTDIKPSNFVKQRTNCKDFLELIPEFDPNNDEEGNPAYIDGERIATLKIDDFNENLEEEEKGTLDQDFEVIEKSSKK